MTGLCAAAPIADEELSAWCVEHLGSPPAARIFERSHLSAVVGVELSDGRLVVVKAREVTARLAACVAVQRHLFASGFPCAEVLAGPAALGRRSATAEAYVPHVDAPPTPTPPQACARLLTALVGRAPRPAEHPELAVAPPWVGWDHPGDGCWPWPDDLDVDLNAQPGPFDDAGRRIARRLAGARGEVIGHLDWEAGNLAWQDGTPVAAHDWDSLAIRPESTVAGAAAAVFPAHGSVVFASLEESEAFLAAYGAERPLTGAQIEEAWAAGAWVLAYNATKETYGGGTGYVEVAARDLEERVCRAGA